MVYSSFESTRRGIRLTLKRFQSALAEISGESILSAEYRDAFFEIIAEKCAISYGTLVTNELQNTPFFSSNPAIRNTVSSLLESGPFCEGLLLPFEGQFEPELLGWLYQYWNAPARDSVTWAISRGTSRGLHHEAVTLATQLYTESYMAEFLASEILSQDPLHKSAAFNVVDPACGAGHLLLAVCKEMKVINSAGILEWVLGQNLCGCDIDSTAVQVTKLALLLFLSRSCRSAHEIASLRAILDQSIIRLPAPLGTLDRKALPFSSAAFDVVITNPPYVGRRKLHPELREYLTEHYPTAAGDLAFAFTLRCIELLSPHGHIGLVTNDKWLRLPAYRKLRWSDDKVPGIFSHLKVCSLVELGGRAFHKEADLHDGIGVTLLHASKANFSESNIFGYAHITAFKSYEDKKEVMNSRSFRVHEVLQSRFAAVDVRSVLVQLVHPHLEKSEQWQPLSVKAEVVVGIQTNNDRLYVKPQWSVPIGDSDWTIHHRGGGIQKWYGLNRWMLNIGGLRRDYEKNRGESFPIEQYFQRVGWTYSWFANGTLALRKKESGWSFGRAAASGVFLADKRVVGFLNSECASEIAATLSGKVQFTEGVIRQLAIPTDVTMISEENVDSLIELQRALVAQDPREVSFAPECVTTPLVNLKREMEFVERTKRLDEESQRACDSLSSGRVLKAHSMNSNDITKAEIVERIAAICCRPSFRHERLLALTSVELKIAVGVVFESICSLLEQDAEESVCIWKAWIFEQLHVFLLTSIGHKWRGAAQHSFVEVTPALSMSEVKFRLTDFLQILDSRFAIPSSALNACQRGLDSWIRSELPKVHDMLFSGAPLLEFSADRVLLRG